MWTRKAAFGLCLSAFASKSAKDMHRSSRLQSTNATRAPERIAASGVAMNVFEGHRTVWPVTSAKWSAASAPPAQLETATDSRPLCADHALSKRSVMVDSDQRLESRTSSIRACSRERSRWSNPIANVSNPGAAVVSEEAVDDMFSGRRPRSAELEAPAGRRKHDPAPGTPNPFRS